MTWWRRRRRAQGWSPPAPVPDGDAVPYPGGRRWADFLDSDGRDESTRRALNEPTQILPTDGPLMTLGGWWRASRAPRR